MFVGILGLLAWLAVVVPINSQMIRPMEITKDSITLTKVSQQFAKAYRDRWSPEGIDLRTWSASRLDLDEIVRKQWNQKPGKLNSPHADRTDVQPDANGKDTNIRPEEP